MLLIGIGMLISTLHDKDDTDPIDGRSGMSLYTDNKTGCQYLAPFFGGLTPKVDKTGKHLCGESNE